MILNREVLKPIYREIIYEAANYRCLEFIFSFDDHSSGSGNLEEVAQMIKENERSYKEMNFFDQKDLHVREVLSRDEFNASGIGYV